MGTARDATARHWADVRSAALHGVGEALSCAMPPEGVVQRLARALVGEFSDVCIIDLEAQPGHPHVFASAVHDNLRDQGDALAALVSDATLRPGHVVDVCRTGEALWLADLDAWGGPERLWTDGRQHAVVKRLLVRSLLVLPLASRDSVLGAMTLMSCRQDRRFDAADFAFARDLARQVTTFIDNALLYEASQAAVQSRERVLAFVAHDLRAPLTSAALSAEQIKDHRGDPQRTDRALERIERALHSANHMIDDLLDLARLSHGRLTLVRDACAMSALVRATVESFGPLARRSGIALLSRVAPGTPELWIDRERVLRIFANLVGNAIKFTPSGGSIEVGAQMRGGLVWAWVQDTGCGISPEDVEHLFDSFWQGDQRDRRGAGLGLSIAKTIVEAHGGLLRVHTRPSEGCRFEFTLTR